MRGERKLKIENCKLEIANCANRTILRHEPDRIARRLRNSICNLQLSFFNFQFSIFILALCALLFAPCSNASAQTVVDKTVASVTNGARATPDLITYSDLVWQLALEPSRPLAERPNSANLNQALRKLEDQLLILQEARKLPIANTDKARQEFEAAVGQKLKEL